MIEWLIVQDWIEGLLGVKGADLFRYKGVMACKGMDKKFIFQGVGMTFFGGFSEISWVCTLFGRHQMAMTPSSDTDLRARMKRESAALCSSDGI